MFDVGNIQQEVRRRWEVQTFPRYDNNEINTHRLKDAVSTMANLVTVM
jgi:hypothetical protein